MITDIMELEKILDDEIQAYSELEQFIVDKKDGIIKGDIEQVVKIDQKLEKYNAAIEKLEEKRKRINPENLTLTQIIERIEEDNLAVNIKNKQGRLKNILNNVDRQNKITSELIQHSLKIIENSVLSIANALVPEGVSYNKKGKMNSYCNTDSVSSRVHEV